MASQAKEGPYKWTAPESSGNILTVGQEFTNKTIFFPRGELKNSLDFSRLKT